MTSLHHGWDGGPTGHAWIAIGTATPREIFDRFVMKDSGSIIDGTEVPGQRVIYFSEDIVYITDELEEAGGVMSPAWRYVEIHFSCLADECSHVFAALP